MIINLIAVDPACEQRVLQYRVPENSRELALLTELFDEHDIDWTTLSSKRSRAVKEIFTDAGGRP